MTHNDDNTPFSAFMDDYYAETDEHLGLIRGNLIALETALQKGERDHAATENDLLRSFHTLKGLSAMVGIPLAETLAHHTETYLKRLYQNDLPLTMEGPGTGDPNHGVHHFRATERESIAGHRRRHANPGSPIFGAPKGQIGFRKTGRHPKGNPPGETTRSPSPSQGGRSTRLAVYLRAEQGAVPKGHRR